jgi:hypothetical protein
MDELKASDKYQNASSKKKEQLINSLADKQRGAKQDAWKQQQLLTAGQITMDTASAIINSLTAKPAWAGVALAVTAGITGAAQLAMVNSQQMPTFARGGDFITQGPQSIIVGDNPGGQERVQVTPLSSPNIDGPQGGGAITVNVSGNVLSQDFVEGELAENIKEAIRRGTDFGIS